MIQFCSGLFIGFVVGVFIGIHLLSLAIKNQLGIGGK